MKGYKIDFMKGTITITADFAKAMNDPTSEEYRTIAKVKADFPSFRIVKRTHKTPKCYKSKDGSITKRNKHCGLTYEKMDAFICQISDKDDTDLLEAFYMVRDIAETTSAPYAIVSQWFMRQFPKFRTNPLFYIENKPAVITLAEYLKLRANDGTKEDDSQIA